MFDAIEVVKKDGVSEDIIKKVREQERRDHEVELKENGFWLGELMDAARFGDDPKLILKEGDLTNLVTSDALRDAAREYLNPERVVTGILLPESAGAAAKPEK